MSSFYKNLLESDYSPSASLSKAIAKVSQQESSSKTANLNWVAFKIEGVPWQDSLISG